MDVRRHDATTSHAASSRKRLPSGEIPESEKLPSVNKHVGERKKARQRPKPAAEPFRGRVMSWNDRRLPKIGKVLGEEIGEKVTNVDTRLR
jgi:hypothetical protein